MQHDPIAETVLKCAAVAKRESARRPASSIYKYILKEFGMDHPGSLSIATITKELDMASIPDDVLKSEWARRNSARRKTRSGGPKIKNNSEEAVKRREQRRAQRQRRAEGKDK